MAIKRRGKKKTLFRTVTTPVSFSPDDIPEKRKREIEALKEIVRRGSLTTQLAEYSRTARNILKEHGLKHTGYSYFEYAGNYDLPLPASYAAEILLLVKGVRAWLKKSDAKNAASEALKLGWHVAALQAEIAISNREGSRTSTATGTRKSAKEVRQERMKIIAIEKGWQQGHELSKTQLQEIYTLLRERHPEYKKKPANQTLSADAQKIGLRQ